MKHKRSLIFVSMLAALMCAPGYGDKPYSYRAADLARETARGTTILPERILREFDPITVFFTNAMGPAEGGPLDDPRPYLTLSFSHPGETRWLDGKTLQFKPAEAWPSLKKLVIEVPGAKRTLYTMLPPPQSVRAVYADGEQGPIHEVTVAFDRAVTVGDLRQVFSMERRPNPGVGNTGAQALPESEYEIKAMPRARRDEPWKFLVALRRPVETGFALAVRFQLSLSTDRGDASVEQVFTTQTPFSLVAMGCGENMVPVVGEDGLRLGKEYALAGNENRTVNLVFSESISNPGYSTLRNFIEISPAVESATYEAYNDRLYIRGPFRGQTLYKVTAHPTSTLMSGKGRPLQMKKDSSFFCMFPSKESTLSWTKAEGILERFGPKELPLTITGSQKVDLRIHRIDPLSRKLWPFTSYPLSVDESVAPAQPGREPADNEADLPFLQDTAGDGSRSDLAERLRAHVRMLASPLISRIIPVSGRGDQPTFTGVDLAPYLRELGVDQEPGCYLVGYRTLNGPVERQYARVQVSDLCLTAVDREGGKRFLVTSYRTAMPVVGAQVVLEGVMAGTNGLVRVLSLVTDERGLTAQAFIPPACTQKVRLWVKKDKDMVVLGTRAPVKLFSGNYWRDGSLDALLDSRDSGAYLQKRTLKGFLTSERPVYKPDEPVYLKGWVRERVNGLVAQLSGPRTEFAWSIVGPGGREWKYPAGFSAFDSCNLVFDEKNLPTGPYVARVLGPDPRQGNGATATYAETSFKKEAYKVPTFEVHLSGADASPSDKPFGVNLAARYYAGGNVGKANVQWQVSSFPYGWVPQGRKGFVFSTDSRYSRLSAGRAQSGSWQKTGVTAEDGSCTLDVDPSAEPDGLPRTWVVEATVTGADEQTVTATGEYRSLPPFVLGLSTERIVKGAGKIPALACALGLGDRHAEGVEVTARFLKREWKSHLVDAPFSEGRPQVVTETSDRVLEESRFVSSTNDTALAFTPKGAGIYVVELEARDRLLRLQTVSMDIYVSGDELITWEKEEKSFFKVVPDKAAYEPGDVATLMIQSPVTVGRVLAVVEDPTGTRYEWLEVSGGKALWQLPLRVDQVPAVPVTLLLMGGRIETETTNARLEELHRPRSWGSSLMLPVNPSRNRVSVTLAHPEESMPGGKIDMGIRLADEGGRPVAGEVALWLVDRAVLSLGNEKNLDPIPYFIDPVESTLLVADLRNIIPGRLFSIENPGGDGMEKRLQNSSILDNATVRKNFKTVAYYNPGLLVGENGATNITIDLPDNLTVFEVRSVASTRFDRFGFAKSSVRVRLPLMVQPLLPRFVRQGDELAAGAIGRVLSGPLGAGAVRLKVEGAELTGDGERAVEWKAGESSRFLFPVKIPRGGNGAGGRVNFSVACARTADGASDAFSVSIPLLPDQGMVTEFFATNLVSGASATAPSPRFAPQPGTLRRDLYFTARPAVVKMARALEYQLEYPHGCLEQRLGRAWACLALKDLMEPLGLAGSRPDLGAMVRDTLDMAMKCRQTDGSFSFWPGSPSYVYLSAQVLEFLVDAREAGQDVSPALIQETANYLRRAVRSDYSKFVDGWHYEERIEALLALSRAGYFDAAYAAELAGEAQYHSAEGLSRLLTALVRENYPDARLMANLKKQLWEKTRFGLQNGKEVFLGMQPVEGGWGGAINAHETRFIAHAIRPLAHQASLTGRLGLMVDRLIDLGGDRGWGNTYANTAVLETMAEVLKQGPATVGGWTLNLSGEGSNQSLALATKQYGVSGRWTPAGPVRMDLAGEARKGDEPWVSVTTRYLPSAPGSQASPVATGFVVEREYTVVGKNGSPDRRFDPRKAAGSLSLKIGDVVEEHIRVINPEDRYFGAVACPLAAGVEPLNPNLLTAPPEAKPAGALTREPSYAQYLDDQVRFYYDRMPKGIYDFYYRTRAMTEGNFTAPAAVAELMYEPNVRGQSGGSAVVVSR